MISDIKLGVLAVVAGLCLAFAGAQTFRLTVEQREHATTVSLWAKDRASWERQTREAVEAARSEEKRRTAEVQKAADEAEEQLARARADADAAAAVGGRLRQRITELAASCSRPPGGSSAPGAGAPAGSTADLLADVQRRLDEAQDTIARFADQAAGAGGACERSYDALTPKAH